MCCKAFWSLWLGCFLGRGFGCFWVQPAYWRKGSSCAAGGSRACRGTPLSSAGDLRPGPRGWLAKCGRLFAAGRERPATGPGLRRRYTAGDLRYIGLRRPDFPVAVSVRSRPPWGRRPRDGARAERSRIRSWARWGSGRLVGVGQSQASGRLGEGLIHARRFPAPGVGLGEGPD